MRDLRELGRQMSEVQDARLQASTVRAGARARLISTLASRSPAAPQRRRWLLPLGMAAGAAALVAVAAPLVARVGRLEVSAGAPGHRVEVGSWVAAPGDASLPLLFSDGSAVTLTPSAVARIAELGRRGAHVVLEGGRAHVAVVHRTGTRWRLRAGPFDVEVTGTRFDLGWDASRGELTLGMAEGTVVVSGGSLPRPQEVSAGQHLAASPRTGRMELGPVTAFAAPAVPTPPAARSQADALTAAPTPDPREGPAPASTRQRPAGGRREASWRERLAAGEYREAMRLLDEPTWRHELQAGAAAELLTLANAARLSDDLGHATQALLALRRRFPHDERAAVAAFTLGRMAFDRQHQPGDAARWFDLYLAEAPHGALAREAAGRLIEAWHLAGERDAARAAARRYLRDHPAGPHADLARRELQDP